jgi:hypothetical protein
VEARDRNSSHFLRDKDHIQPDIKLVPSALEIAQSPDVTSQSKHDGTSFDLLHPLPFVQLVRHTAASKSSGDVRRFRLSIHVPVAHHLSVYRSPAGVRVFVRCDPVGGHSCTCVYRDAGCTLADRRGVRARGLSRALRRLYVVLVTSRHRRGSKPHIEIESDHFLFWEPQRAVASGEDGSDEVRLLEGLLISLQGQACSDEMTASTAQNGCLELELAFLC